MGLEDINSFEYKYVCGFMFSPDGSRVALVRKNRPQWQNGKLNGIGGKIELNEDPFDCIVREFYEETGCETTSTEWVAFGEEKGDDWMVIFFCCMSDKIDTVKTTTDEDIIIVDVDNVMNESTIPNLKYLIPDALGFLQ